MYDTLSEATQVARGAAKSHWDTRKEPSGVLVQLPDATEREDCVFGEARKPSK